eukprot:1986579-Pleurochrysis_carterae.AAC.1
MLDETRRSTQTQGEANRMRMQQCAVPDTEMKRDRMRARCSRGWPWCERARECCSRLPVRDADGWIQ